jgi:hypothetical protein
MRHAAHRGPPALGERGRTARAADARSSSSPRSESPSGVTRRPKTSTTSARSARSNPAPACPTEHGQGPRRGPRARRITRFVRVEPVLRRRGRRATRPTVESDTPEPRPWSARSRHLRAVRQAQPRHPARDVALGQRARGPDRLADMLVAPLQFKLEERQELLETVSVSARLERIYKARCWPRSSSCRSRRSSRRGSSGSARDPARVLAQRADEGDPEGARRQGGPGRPRGARAQQLAAKDPGGGAVERPRRSSAS